MRIELLHVRNDLLEIDFHQQPSMTCYFFKFEYLGLLSCQLWFEVRSHPQKFLRFPPLLGVFIPTVLAFALHDPFGEVQVLSVDLALYGCRYTFRR